MKILEAIEKRRSTVSFSSKYVEKETIESLFMAASKAPSSYNEQPWRFMYGEKGSDVYDGILRSLVPGNREWANKAPLLIVALASKYLERTGEINKYAWYDLGQAVSNLSTQATSAGLKLHQMGGFSPNTLREVFDISEDYEIATVIAVGYHGDLNDLDPVLERREKSIPSRKSLNEILINTSPRKEAISIN